MNLRCQIDKLKTRSGALFAIAMDYVPKGLINEAVVNEVLVGGWIPNNQNDAPPRSLDWK